MKESRPFRLPQNGTFVRFLRRPFPLLDDHWSRLFLVAFSGAFATIFILYFNPFNIKNIVYDDAFANFLSIGTGGIWGGLSIALSQFGLRKLFGLHHFNVGQFLGWVVIDFLVVCLVQFMLFGEHLKMVEFMLVARYTLSLTFLPYLMACLIIYIVIQHRMTTRVAASNKRYLFKEANEKVVLAIHPREILYLKAENNYTLVVYRENDQVKNKLIRATLKILEAEMSSLGIIRIHRSFMVNLTAIASLRRERGELYVQVTHLDELSLKVSASFQKALEEAVAANTRLIHPK